MSKTFPWYKAEPGAFFDATRGWPVDLKGPYRLLIDLIYYHDGKVADDPVYIAGQLGLSSGRKWTQTVKPALLKTGKITIQDGYIFNARASAETANRKHLGNISEISQKKSGKSTELTNRQFNKNKDLGFTEEDRDIDRDSTASSTGAREEKFEVDTLLDRLLDAGGNAVDEKAVGIAVPSAVLSWLDLPDPPDLDIDILPTIRAIADRPRNRPISSWAYFRPAVFEAFRQRTEPQPPSNTGDRDGQTDHPARNGRARRRYDDQQAARCDDRRSRLARLAIERESALSGQPTPVPKPPTRGERGEDGGAREAGHSDALPCP